MPKREKFTHTSSISYEPMTTPLSTPKSKLPQLPRESVSSAISICLEASQQIGEHMPSPKTSGPSANNQESASFDEDSESLILRDEWEGEVVEEVFDGSVLKFKVAWVPTLEPGENLSAEMRAVWEKKKAETRANTQRPIDKNQPVGVKPGIKKRPGRPRKKIVIS